MSVEKTGIIIRKNADIEMEYAVFIKNPKICDPEPAIKFSGSFENSSELMPYRSSRKTYNCLKESENLALNICHSCKNPSIWENSK